MKFQHNYFTVRTIYTRRKIIGARKCRLFLKKQGSVLRTAATYVATTTKADSLSQMMSDTKLYCENIINKYPEVTFYFFRHAHSCGNDSIDPAKALSFKVQNASLSPHGIKTSINGGLKFLPPPTRTGITNTTPRHTMPSSTTHHHPHPPSNDRSSMFSRYGRIYLPSLNDRVPIVDIDYICVSPLARTIQTAFYMMLFPRLVKKYFDKYFEISNNHSNIRDVKNLALRNYQNTTTLQINNLSELELFISKNIKEFNTENSMFAHF